jgi:hypothetical protein
MRIFCSTLTYQLGRELGVERAAREFQRQLQRPDRQSLPVARVFARIAQLGHQLDVYHGASTTLPKARSRAAHAAAESGADLWIMCDDDVECDTGTLVRLIDLAGASHASVLPCLLRGTDTEQETVNVVFEPGALIQTVAGVPFKRALRAGTGLMVLTRAALLQVLEFTERCELDRWRDDDGKRKVPVFQLMLSQSDDDAWFGEDFSFCTRLYACGVELRAVLAGASMHAGSALALDGVR